MTKASIVRICIICLAILFLAYLPVTAQTMMELKVYVPFVAKGKATPTPAFTPTTPPTPTATTRPTSNTGTIQITGLLANGTGTNEPNEYVAIKNTDNHAIQVQGWALTDNANHVFVFPSFVMQPGQVCRVYTNEYHADFCNFNYQSAAAIWNNGGDCATLKNSSGAQVSRYCY